MSLGDLAALDASVERVREAFGARPLSARSILLSYLLGTHPPSASAAKLVEFGRLFGLRPGTVRTALSRMVTAGEASVDDSRYRLAGRLLERQQAQDLTQRPPADTWDGTWWTAVALTDDDRTSTDRRHLRAAMATARMGELRPGVWMRPANLDGPGPQPELVVSRGALAASDERALAETLWPVTDLETAAGTLLDALVPLAAALADGDGLSNSDRAHVLVLTFEASAVAVRFLRAEPALPPELADMPSSRRLRHDYPTINRRFLHTLEHHLVPGTS